MEPGAPWIKDKRGVLARQFAINAWGTQQEEIDPGFVEN